MKTKKQSREDKVWSKYEKMVGTEIQAKGGLFSRKALDPDKYHVIGIRPSSAFIMNMKTMEAKHPAFELLLKNDKMKRARWSRPFPIREIKLK